MGGEKIGKESEKALCRPVYDRKASRAHEQIGKNIS